MLIVSFLAFAFEGKWDGNLIILTTSQLVSLGSNVPVVLLKHPCKLLYFPITETEALFGQNWQKLAKTGCAYNAHLRNRTHASLGGVIVSSLGGQNKSFMGSESFILDQPLPRSLLKTDFPLKWSISKLLRKHLCELKNFRESKMIQCEHKKTVHCDRLFWGRAGFKLGWMEHDQSGNPLLQGPQMIHPFTWRTELKL